MHRRCACTPENPELGNFASPSHLLFHFLLLGGWLGGKGGLAKSAWRHNSRGTRDAARGWGGPRFAHFHFKAWPAQHTTAHNAVSLSSREIRGRGAARVCAAARGSSPPCAPLQAFQVTPLPPPLPSPPTPSAGPSLGSAISFYSPRRNSNNIK